MATGQTIADLKIRLEAQGTGEVEYLRNELGRLQKNLKLTETQLDRQRVAVKNLGRATKDTTNGMRLQISALEKIRTNASSTGATYSRLTRDINKLNTALQTQIDIERGVGSSGGRTRLLPFAGMREGLVGRDLKTGMKFDDKRGKTTADTLAQLLAADYFTKRPGGFGKDAPDGFRGVKEFTLNTHNDTIALLTEALNSQADATKGITLQSKEYRQILTQLKTATNKYTQTIEAQDAWADKDLAEQNYRQRRGRQLQDKFEQHRQLMWNKGFGGRSFEKEDSGGTMRVRSEGLFETPELDAYKQLPREGQFLKWLLESPQWKSMKGEMKKQGSKERGFSFMPQYGEKVDKTTPFGKTYKWSDDLAKYQTDLTYGLQLRGTQKKGYGKSKFLPSLLEQQPEFPKTRTGYEQQIGKLARDEKNLLLNSSAQIKTRKELDKVTEEYNLELEKYEKRIKGVTRAQERSTRLGAKGVAGTRDPVTGAMIAKGGSQYPGRDSQGRMIGTSSDPFAIPAPKPVMQTVQSLQEFINAQEKIVSTGKANINTLSKTRSKFDEIRNTLDPTSKQFQRVTQAIAKTDKALAKLNTNRFSGKNLARTGQSILGASFFGGPAGFLGSTLGAGFEALRPGGDMAQGAITGGLVASQVLQPIAGFGAESANYTAMIEKSKIALEAATKVEGDAIASKEAYKIALATAAGVTERFNVPQELAARGMTRLSAAVIGAGGNIHNAGIAFENISAAIKATGGSTEDTKAAVTAMVQIFSKGRVSAEELSGQLGERFPAAVTLFAEANNMTTQELQKGLKDGAIGLDKLWKFVLKLGDKYKGVAEAIGSASVEAGVRSQIAWNEVKLAVGGALQPIGADLQVVGAEILTTLVPALTKLAEITGAVLKVFSGVLVGVVENLDKVIASIGAFIAATTILHGQALAALTKALILVPLQSFISSLGLAAVGQKAFASATGMATAQVRIFNIAMNKNLIILGATALVAAGSAVWHFGRQWQRTVDEIEKGKMPLNDARIKVAELEKELKGESNEKLRLRLQTQIDMYKEAIETRMELVKAAELAEAESFKNASAKPDEGKWATVQEYVKELGNGGKHLQDTFINAFKGMEDAMVNFVMTGKIRFKEFARSVIADIARMIAKQMMFNMISGFMNSLGGGGGLGMTQGKNMPSNPNFVGVGANIPTVEPSNIYSGLKGINNDELNPYGFAKGGVFAKNRIVPYAKGGIVNRPTLFPFANGVGLMSEVGPEAIMPLKRGKGGRLGVEVAGGGGGTVVNVSVDAKGTKVEGDGKQMAQLGKMLGSAIEAELVKQKRPGGLLAN